MNIQKGICRLCFKLYDKYQAVDEVIKDVLDILLPKIDMVAIQKPIMCINCEETLFECFDFKAKCFYTHDDLVPFVRNKKNIKLNLKQIYMNKYENINSVPEDQSICGFCMSSVKNCSAVFLDVGENNTMLQEMLERCLPELDFSIIEEPVICSTCHGSLDEYFHFVINFLIIEDKIKKYKETQNINSNNEIELSGVLHYILRGVINEVDGNGIIEFDQLSHDPSKKDEKVEDNSALDIDVEKLDYEPEFKPRDMLDCNNEIDTINREETYCRNNKIDIKQELFVKVENLKILCDEAIEIKTDNLDFYRFDECVVMTKPLIKQTFMKENVMGITTYRSECSFQTPDENNLNGHLLKQEYSEVNTYSCDTCSFQTKYKYCLEKHSLNHKEPSKMLVYQCEFCSFQTKRECDLREHVLIHKNPSALKIYKCDVCTFQTLRKNVFKTHSLTHKEQSEVSVYKCEYCPFQSRRKFNLKIHLLKHQNPNKYKCNSCTYQTVYKCYLKRHSLKHKNPSEVKMCKCDICPFQTKYRGIFRLHLLKHKNLEVTLYKCNSCTYQTLNKRFLKSHLLTHRAHLELKVYKCVSCNYQTTIKQLLNAHLLKHKDSFVAYKCKFCTFQSKSKRYLETHLWKHTNVELARYKCDTCTYQTMKKRILISHLLTHSVCSELKMYICDSCAFQTIRKQSLKRHLLTHKDPSEVAMCKCDLCPFQTKYSDSLKVHSLTKHKKSEDIMYKCASCMYQTINKRFLKSHVLIHKARPE